MFPFCSDLCTGATHKNLASPSLNYLGSRERITFCFLVFLSFLFFWFSCCLRSCMLLLAPSLLRHIVSQLLLLLLCVFLYNLLLPSTFLDRAAYVLCIVGVDFSVVSLLCVDGLPFSLLLLFTPRLCFVHKKSLVSSQTLFRTRYRMSSEFLFALTSHPPSHFLS